MECLPAPIGLQRKKLAQAARLWASGQLSTHHENHDEDEEFDSAAAALGLEVIQAPSHEAVDSVFHIWPENVWVWLVWSRIQTLWRVGFRGREGLDYAGLHVYLRQVQRLGPRKLAQAFICLQAMEAESLDEWEKQRAANAP